MQSVGLFVPRWLTLCCWWDLKIQEMSACLGTCKNIQLWLVDVGAVCGTVLHSGSCLLLRACWDVLVGVVAVCGTALNSESCPSAQSVCQGWDPHALPDITLSPPSPPLFFILIIIAFFTEGQLLISDYLKLMPPSPGAFTPPPLPPAAVLSLTASAVLWITSMVTGFANSLTRVHWISWVQWWLWLFTPVVSRLHIEKPTSNVFLGNRFLKYIYYYLYMYWKVNIWLSVDIVFKLMFESVVHKGWHILFYGCI